MIFVIFAILIIATTSAEDGQNEIISNAIIEKGSSTDKSIESREYIDKKTIVLPVSGPPMKSRRSRYLRQAPRPRRRPPFEPRNMRRPGNNFPNLYGPRSRFKPNAPFRPPPPKSRFRYRDNWRHKWPEHHHPPMYLDEDEMEQDSPYEEYDDVDEYRGDDLWYSPKKYRDMYDDAVPTASKYNEKRSPSRYLASYDFSRPKVRANYDPFEGVPMKDLAEWQDRTRYSKNYRNILDILTNGKKFEEQEESMQIPVHRFKVANWNRFKPLEEDEYDFSGKTNNPKSRRFKTEKAVMRRPQIADDSQKYEGDVTDVSKYFAIMHAAGLPSKEIGQEAVYSAKYRGRDAEKGGDRSKLKIDEDVSTSSSSSSSSSSSDTNNLHDWKRTQKPNDFQSQFVPTVEKSNGVVDAATSVARNQNYKDDHLSPSELIAYMSVDPGESVVGKEERYLHAVYPFSEKLSDHDILKATFPRKISPIIDQDLEITFDDRIGDWKH